MKKIVKISSILLVIVGFIVFLMTRFNLTGECDDENIYEYLSPDSANTATVFVRDCGATTGSSTQVSINNYSVLVTIGDNRKNIKLNWESSKILDIEYNGKPEKVFSSIGEYKDIKINFPTLEDTN